MMEERYTGICKTDFKIHNFSFSLFCFLISKPGLLKLSDVSDKSFDWKKVLKYSLDMSSILCAKHDEKQEGKNLRLFDFRLMLYAIYKLFTFKND